MQVLVDGVAIGTLEGAYAERLSSRRPVRARRPLAGIPPPRGIGRRRPGPAGPSRGCRVWHSDRQSLSSELAHEVAEFRAEGAGG